MTNTDNEMTGTACGAALRNAESIIEFERRVERRARELTAGSPCEFNLAPTLQLVRQAFALGYDVIRADKLSDNARNQADRPA